jgi:hypothetical protein
VELRKQAEKFVEPGFKLVMQVRQLVVQIQLAAAKAETIADEDCYGNCLQTLF